MPTLNIPLASPVFFVYKTGAGTIRQSEILPDNSLYPSGTTSCGVVYPEFSQPYNCDDQIEVQFEYENGSSIPFLQIMDTEDEIQYTDLGTNVSGNFWEYSWIWSDVIANCPACLYLRIVSATLGSNLISCGDSGTFETGTVGSWGVSTGGSNVVAKSSTVARTGTFSAQVTAPGAVSASEREILGCTASFSLSANTFYKYSLYVYDDSSTPFIQDGRPLNLDISDFSDATVIAETTPTPSVDGRDTWLLVDITFRTGSDTSGRIFLETSADPQVNGILYIDDMILAAYSLVEEAVTNNIQLKSSHDCTAYLQYYNDEDSMNQYFGNNFKNRLRVPLIVGRPNIQSENLVFVDSIGTRAKISSYMSKIYPISIGYLPDHLVNTFQIALEHDHLLIDGIEYTSEENFEPETVDNYGLRTGSIQMYLTEFDLQNTQC